MLHPRLASATGMVPERQVRQLTLVHYLTPWSRNIFLFSGIGIIALIGILATVTNNARITPNRFLISTNVCSTLQATQTLVQLTLNAQATFILAGITQTAAMEQSKTANPQPQAPTQTPTEIPALELTSLQSTLNAQATKIFGEVTQTADAENTIGISPQPVLPVRIDCTPTVIVETTATQTSIHKTMEAQATLLLGYVTQTAANESSTH